MTRRSRVAAVSLVLLTAACGGAGETVVTRTPSAEVTDADIDRDPLALLPSGALGYGWLDARRLSASPFGKQLLAVVKARSPVPESAGFDPERDLEAAALACHTDAGLDVVAVLRGRFEPQAIRAAADGTTRTPLGTPVTASEYLGRRVYTSSEVGFVVLTAKTVLVGNESGIRRALDRLHRRAPRRTLPGWVVKLLERPDAAIVLGATLRDQVAASAALGDLPFLGGADTVRLVGNFSDAGLTAIGAVTYPDDKAATSGAGQMRETHQRLQSIAWLASFLGMQNPLTAFSVEPVGKEAKFQAALDARGVAQLVDLLARSLGLAGAPRVVDATVSPGVGARP